MSDGHYCIVRDLGLVKGGKGMKHHEVIVDFNWRGALALFKRLFAWLRTNASPRARSYRLRPRKIESWDEAPAAGISAVARSSPPYRDIG
jgi:hypothetical protein